MKENWDHLTHEELEIFHKFYTEYLAALTRKGLRNPTKEIKEKIDKVERRQRELSDAIKKDL